MGKLFMSIVVTGFFLVFLLGLASAETIIISEDLNSYYNLGDTLNINITVIADESGDIMINLKCDDKEIKKYNTHLNHEEDGGRKTIIENPVLTFSYLSETIGDCILTTKYLNKTETQEFEIGDEIEITTSLNKKDVEVGESVVVKGVARKKNGERVEGYIELRVEETEIDLLREISEGDFNIGFSFPEKTESKEYIIQVKAYEKRDDEMTNKGTANETVFVKQTPTSLDVLMDESIVPGKEFEFDPVIYDQAENKIEDRISYKVLDLEGEIFEQKIINSNETRSLKLPTYSESGYWTFEIGALGLEKEKQFYVEELQKANFTVVDGILEIKNIGNVEYRKPVEFNIGNQTKIKTVSLEKNESMKLTLSAPEGVYDVGIRDGEDDVVIGNVALTGQAVGVDEFKEGMGFIWNNILVWIFLIFVFGASIILLARNRQAKKSYSYAPSEGGVEKVKSKKKKESDVKDISKKDKVPGNVEHAVVSNGRKEEVPILAIKLPELNKAKKEKEIKEIIDKIKQEKGAMYEKENEIYVLFSSVSTKTFDNDMKTIKVGQEVNNKLKEFDERKDGKINYGVGLHKGELILKKEEDSLKFTGVKGTISTVKKVLKLANKELLLSDQIVKSVMSQVKTSKEEREGMKVHKIIRITNREKHKDFIRGFLEREKERFSGDKE